MRVGRLGGFRYGAQCSLCTVKKEGTGESEGGDLKAIAWSDVSRALG